MQKRGGAFGGNRGEHRRGEAVEPQRAVAEPLPELVRGDTTFISEKIRRDIAKIADRLAPYEAFARTVHLKNPAESVAFFEILEDTGAVNAELIKFIRAVTREFANTIGLVEDTYYSKKRWQPEKANHFSRILDEQCYEIEQRARIARLEIFPIFFKEIMGGSYVLSIMRKIRQFERRGDSFLGAMADTAQSAMEGKDNFDQAAVIDWFRFSQSFGKQKRALPPAELIGGITAAQAFQELKQVTFDEATGGRALKVALPGVRWRDSDIFCDISVEKNQSPFVICKLRLIDARGVHVADGYLSRITGELAVSGTLTVSAQEIFSFFQADEKYKGLKDIILAAVYKLWKEKDLQEEAAVELNMEEGDDGDGEEELISEVPRLPTKEESLRAFYEQFGNQDARGLAKERRREDGELSRFSWRRVIEALKRCGVTVELDHDHPKLFYKGETTNYINRHEPDPRRNRAVVNRVLRELNIPRDEFMKKLW